MASNSQRQGSIRHADAPDGHRYFIISDREFTDCGRASESSYAGARRCRCDACKDAHAIAESVRRRARAAAARRRRQTTQGPGWLPAA